MEVLSKENEQDTKREYRFNASACAWYTFIFFELIPKHLQTKTILESSLPLVSLLIISLQYMSFEALIWHI